MKKTVKKEKINLKFLNRNFQKILKNTFIKKKSIKYF